MVFPWRLFEEWREATCYVRGRKLLVCWISDACVSLTLPSGSKSDSAGCAPSPGPKDDSEPEEIESSLGARAAAANQVSFGHRRRSARPKPEGPRDISLNGCENGGKKGPRLGAPRMAENFNSA